MQVQKVVIPVAGKGTRFLPATKAVPKELLPLVDRPLIHEVVDEAVASGIKDLVLVTGEGKESVAKYFGPEQVLEEFLEARGDDEFLGMIRGIARMVKVETTIQEKPRGLGHAVLCARPQVGSLPFAVILPDDLIDSKVPCTAQLLALFGRTGKSVVALQEVPEDETHRYGIVEAQQTGPGEYRIVKLVEKPSPGTAPSNLAVIGRYILVPGIFDILENVAPGAGGEIQLTDALDRLAQEDAVHGLVFEGMRHDAGDKLGYMKANIHYALKDRGLGPPLLEYMRGLVNDAGEG